jgi:hypothetical protein
MALIEGSNGKIEMISYPVSVCILDYVKYKYIGKKLWKYANEMTNIKCLN